MAKAAAPPAINPAPPGQSGGQYRPLSEADLLAIFQTSLDLLSRLGMGEVPERLADLLIRNGAQYIDYDRISFPEPLV
ncbi:MAG: trimethylamine methyltransferase, partial [Pseudomonadota bacterium]